MRSSALLSFITANSAVKVNPFREPMKLNHRRFLLLLTAAALSTVLALPSTRWVVGVQVGSALHLCHPIERIFDYITPHAPNSYTGLAAFDQKRVHMVLAHHPNDFPLQIGAVMPYFTGGLFARGSLRALIPHFPDTPSLFANLLRCDAAGPVRLERPEIDSLTGERPEKSSLRPVTSPADLASYDQTAATGERLDPDNAYFPFVRSAGLFAAHRDSDGLAASGEPQPSRSGKNTSGMRRPASSIFISKPSVIEVPSRRPRLWR